jgi:hypothetical protein
MVYRKSDPQKQTRTDLAGFSGFAFGLLSGETYLSMNLTQKTALVKLSLYQVPLKD